MSTELRPGSVDPSIGATRTSGRRGLGDPRVHQAQSQGLEWREVNAPAVLAALATAFDRRIVSVERRLPLDVIAVQAERARQRRVDEHVRVVWAKSGCVGEHQHPACSDSVGLTSGRLGQPPGWGAGHGCRRGPRPPRRRRGVSCGSLGGVNILIYGDTVTSPAMRHEVPISIGDPFLYLETNGRRTVLTNSLEDERIARDAPELERILEDHLGRDELIGSGLSRGEIEREVCARAVDHLGITQAVVPPDFPLALADRLREGGVALAPEENVFIDRRRHKSAAQLQGIRRASDAAVAAMGAAAAMLREAEIDGDRLILSGELLTAEAVRDRIREVCAQAGAPPPPRLLAQPLGPNPAGGHDPGAGPLPPHPPVEIDLWPRAARTRCWSDMTRAFVRGDISDAIAEIHALVLDAHERVCAAARPGTRCADLYGIACDVFEAAGHPTGRTKAPGEIR